VLGYRESGGLVLAETRYAAGARVAAHAHAEGLLVHVLAGSMEEERPGARVHCTRDTLLYHPAGEIHAHRFHERGGRCFVVIVREAWLAGVSAADGVREAGRVGPLALRNERANGLAAALYREFRDADASSALAIDGLCLALHAELLRKHTRRERGGPPPWLGRAVELLHARVGEGVWLGEIAEAVGVHPVHLSRTFRRHYGCTPGEYARRCCLERAREALIEGKATLAEIALAAGFSDQAHFSRWFKRAYGVSPGSFRREHGREGSG
jgi:AraC family transcriptional regulator